MDEASRRKEIEYRTRFLLTQTQTPNGTVEGTGLFRFFFISSRKIGELI